MAPTTIATDMRIALPRSNLAAAAARCWQRVVMLGQMAVGVGPEVSVQPADCIIADVTLAATALSTSKAHGMPAGNSSSGDSIRQASPSVSVVVPRTSNVMGQEGHVPGWVRISGIFPPGAVSNTKCRLG